MVHRRINFDASLKRVWKVFFWRFCYRTPTGQRLPHRRSYLLQRSFFILKFLIDFHTILSRWVFLHTLSLCAFHLWKCFRCVVLPNMSQTDWEAFYSPLLILSVFRLLMLLSKQKSGSSTVWSQFAIRTPNLGADKGGLFARHLIIAMIWKPHTKWNTFWFKSFGTSGQALVQATDRNFIDSKPDLFKTENMHLIEAGSDSYIVRFQKLESKLELRTVLLHRTSNVPEDTFKFEKRLKESANLGHTKSITNLRRICRSM